MSENDGIIPRTQRYLNRYQEIISVFVKHGFGDFVTSNNLEKYLNIDFNIFARHKSHVPTDTFTRGERIRMAFEELGPTFVKFGQIMSNRPDLLPPEYIRELEKLQDDVPPFPVNKAKKLIELELGMSIEELFREFRHVPIASASIAQVHVAQLHSGQWVVLKVQRPHIHDIIETDIAIMHTIASLIDSHIPALSIFDSVNIVKEFAKTIHKEVNFIIEATQIERFAHNFHEEPHIVVPRVYREMSTKRVLVMEYVKGTKVSQVDELRKHRNTPQTVADRGTVLMLKQIFTHGFFHADPHPGNILVLPHNTICFIDFGMMGTVIPRYREHLGDIMIGVVNKDAKRIIKVILQFPHMKRIERVDELEQEVLEIIEEYSYLAIKDISIGDMLRRVIAIIFHYRIRIPPNLYLLAKALITIEGTAKSLAPNFNMIEHIKPFAQHLMQERFNPVNITKDAFLTASEFGLLIRDLPEDLREVVQQVKRGQLRIEFNVKGIDPMLTKHDKISNRIAFSIVLSALIIGSSLIVLSQIPPKWYDVPVIGIVGFLVAGLMGFWLLVSMIRNNRM